MKIIVLLLIPVVTLVSCSQNGEKAKFMIPEITKNEVINTQKTNYPDCDIKRMEKGVEQAAKLWQESDGTAEEFKLFCTNNFIGSEQERETAFLKISRNFEILNGNFHKTEVELKEPIHMDFGDIHPVDEMFGSYNAMAHMINDFYSNKIAFYIILNFPAYSLQEKSKYGQDWTRLQWAYARLGEIFTSRIPPQLLQEYSELSTKAENYIAEYNIFMDKLTDINQKKYFPEGLKLITHWGLRDELKSNYMDKENGFAKQKMIYEVMMHIIRQTIPQQVINSKDYDWNPKTNQLFKNGNEQKIIYEPDTRYQHLLSLFRTLKKMDQYCTQNPTYIARAFDENMEISQPEVEALFTRLVSSPEVKEVARLIEHRLGRPLEPFDIWYNGFKPNDNTLNEEKLDQIISKKYHDKNAFEKDLPNILVKIGFTSAEANRIASLIQVDPSRGAGHAWGAEMRGDKSRLRTRIGKNGMNYKGYNIAIHEFGHNVEQTITLYDMDYYFLHGVPNTAFTEAIAFLFQNRDLEFLGYHSKNDENYYLQALNNFWSNYEIMGVSLVDMKVWKWLYENPDCTAALLKENVIRIACEVWNEYYAPVFGMKDQPILAIYSHMIDNPLYLPAYPVGHIIDFQIEQAVKNKNIASEISKMLKQGRIIPQLWMKGAVNNEISVEPVLQATREVLNQLKNK